MDQVKVILDKVQSQIQPGARHLEYLQQRERELQALLERNGEEVPESVVLEVSDDGQSGDQPEVEIVLKEPEGAEMTSDSRQVANIKAQLANRRRALEQAERMRQIMPHIYDQELQKVEDLERQLAALTGKGAVAGEKDDHDTEEQKQPDKPLSNVEYWQELKGVSEVGELLQRRAELAASEDPTGLGVLVEARLAEMGWEALVGLSQLDLAEVAGKLNSLKNQFNRGSDQRDRVAILQDRVKVMAEVLPTAEQTAIEFIEIHSGLLEGEELTEPQMELLRRHMTTEFAILYSNKSEIDEEVLAVLMLELMELIKDESDKSS
jgi:hypothetical protein